MKMTSSGSPCGACKFLRRKCVINCVFAPYFCHDEGATHFAAIHKVFGAHNASKLLAHLPITQRCEAAVSISYEAQARLQDPIYGCVSHIFALQQQVVNLQAQLLLLKEHAAQGALSSSSTANPNGNFHGDVQNCFFLENSNTVPQFNPNPSMDSASAFLFSENGIIDPNSFGIDENSMIPEEDVSFSSFEASSSSISSLASLDMQTMQWEIQDTDDLLSVAFGKYS